MIGGQRLGANQAKRGWSCMVARIVVGWEGFQGIFRRGNGWTGGWQELSFLFPSHHKYYHTSLFLRDTKTFKFELSSSGLIRVARICCREEEEERPYSWSCCTSIYTTRGLCGQDNRPLGTAIAPHYIPTPHLSIARHRNGNATTTTYSTSCPRPNPTHHHSLSSTACARH